MPKKSGFILIEFLLYLFLFTALVALGLDWSLTLIYKNRELNNNCTTIITLYMIHDLLLKDIHQAPYQLSHWYIISPHKLVWAGASRAIGWYYSNDKIIRKEGIYNPEDDTWSLYTQTCMSLPGTTFSCSVQTVYNRATNVSFTLENGQSVVKNTITIFQSGANEKA